MFRLKTLLRDGIDDTLYIADYTVNNLQTCKTCTISEFLREITEYKDYEMTSIIKYATFRKF